MITLPGSDSLDWQFTQAQRAELLSLRIDEQFGMPSFFEAVFHDPHLQLWSASEAAIGTTLTQQTGADPAYEGIIWGRDLLTTEGSPQVRLWGSDASFRCHVAREFRSYRGGLSSCLKNAFAASGLKVEVSSDLPGRFAQEDSFFVQYDETAWEFLERLGALAGHDVLAYRGKLYLGGGPGERQPGVTIDLSDAAWAGSSLELSESWTDQPAAYQFSVYGMPDQAGPKLPQGAVKDAVTEVRANLKLKKLQHGGAEAASPGVLVTSAEKTLLAQRLSQQAERHGKRGRFSTPAPMHQSIVPGQKLSFRKGSQPLASDFTVAGISYLRQKSDQRYVISLGMPPRARQQSIDLRPARHLWPALVSGAYQPQRGRIEVTLIGWHPESVPLPARLPGVELVKSKLASLRVPHQGELQLVGFEGGRPEAPVVVHGLFDGEAPETKPGEYIIKVADNALHFTLADANLKVETKKFALELQADKTKAKVKANIDFEKP